MKIQEKMLKKRHMVIACTDDLEVNKRIFELCRDRYLICNIADNPELCDYYLGGIVTGKCENCNFNKWKITHNG
jgi:precorrin-2 dehydrogenase/sirohydrochlorin ferrochelatase